MEQLDLILEGLRGFFREPQWCCEWDGALAGGSKWWLISHRKDCGKTVMS